jgi:hypothetical protein
MLRRTICIIVDHNWTRHRYPAPLGEDQPGGTYLKCVRCGKVEEGAGLPGGPMVAGF